MIPHEWRAIQRLIANLRVGRQPSRTVGDGNRLSLLNLLYQCALVSEITLFRKPCKRSLNPVGTSKTRSSPVIKSNFRVLS